MGGVGWGGSGLNFYSFNRSSIHPSNYLTTNLPIHPFKVHVFPFRLLVLLEPILPTVLSVEGKGGVTTMTGHWLVDGDT